MFKLHFFIHACSSVCLALGTMMVTMDLMNGLNEVPHDHSNDPQKLAGIVQACCWIHSYDIY